MLGGILVLGLVARRAVGTFSGERHCLVWLSPGSSCCRACHHAGHHLLEGEWPALPPLSSFRDLKDVPLDILILSQVHALHTGP